jgi:hypothetical protein
MRGWGETPSQGGQGRAGGKEKGPISLCLGLYPFHDFGIAGEAMHSHIYFGVVDFPAYFVIMPSEMHSPIPLLGGRLWLGFRKPHFLEKEWGFLFKAFFE